jgi:hypothetical protein
MTFDIPGIIDLRARLPKRSWTIGVRDATTSLTYHWNGPAVSPAHLSGEGLIAQLIADANWQMRASWGGTKDGAPHLMYHLVFGGDGTVYQTADMFEILWHAAHQDANAHGLALHFPIGEGQTPTPPQIASALRVTDFLRVRCSIPRERVLGHLEWKHATACPGPILMELLHRYRGNTPPVVAPTPTPPGMRQFKLTCDGKANVRQGPGTEFKVAGTLKSGTVVYVDIVKQGQPIGGNTNWIHMARVPNEQADLGFISETLGVWA